MVAKTGDEEIHEKPKFSSLRVHMHGASQLEERRLEESDK